VETNEMQNVNVQEEIPNAEGETQEAPEVEIYSQEEPLSQKLEEMGKGKETTVRDTKSMPINDKTNLGTKGGVLGFTLNSQDDTQSTEEKREQAEDQDEYASQSGSPN
jgi:hypothetical protein